MSDGYDKALEALRRGETIRIQHWKRKEANQHGTPVEVVDTVALFQPVMIITGGEEIPLASRGLEQDEADKLASMPNVQDERNQIHDKE